MGKGQVGKKQVGKFASGQKARRVLANLPFAYLPFAHLQICLFLRDYEPNLLFPEKNTDRHAGKVEVFAQLIL